MRELLRFTAKVRVVECLRGACLEADDGERREREHDRPDQRFEHHRTIGSRTQ